MTRHAAALLGALVVVVDQIDGGYAAVELPDRQIVLLPAAALPAGAEEGDRLRLELRAPEEPTPGRRPHSKQRRDHEHPHHP